MARGRKSQTIEIADPLVYLEWDDHHANGAWQEKIDHTPSPCASIGWLTKEDRKGITIAASVDPGSQTVGNTQYVLKSDITFRKIIKA